MAAAAGNKAHPSLDCPGLGVEGRGVLVLKK